MKRKYAQSTQSIKERNKKLREKADRIFYIVFFGWVLAALMVITGLILRFGPK